MRKISKDITLTIDGRPQEFRLTKPDAFSGVEILRLLLRLQDQWGGEKWNKGTVSDVPCSAGTDVTVPAVTASPSILDLITSLSADELRSVMTSCLNHASVLLPAGPNPVMTGSEWGYPELKHDTVSCMKLVLEEIAWALEGFFGDGGRTPPPADVNTSP